jgi:hypothetical protein
MVSGAPSLITKGEPEMPYRSLVPLLIVKDQGGTLWHHYQGAGSSGRHRGPYIPWLNDEQRDHWLRKGFVEEIAESEAPVELPRPEPAPADDAIPETRYRHHPRRKPKADACNCAGSHRRGQPA